MTESNGTKDSWPVEGDPDGEASAMLSGNADDLVFVYEEHKLQEYKRGCGVTESETSEYKLVDTHKRKGQSSDESPEASMLVHAVSTVAILGTSMMIALFLQAVIVVWSVMGATVCFMVAFILPTSYHLKLTPSNNLNVWGKARRYGAIALLAVAGLACFVCTTTTIIKIVGGANPCPKWSSNKS